MVYRAARNGVAEPFTVSDFVTDGATVAKRVGECVAEYVTECITASEHDACSDRVAVTEGDGRSDRYAYTRADADTVAAAAGGRL